LVSDVDTDIESVGHGQNEPRVDFGLIGRFGGFDVDRIEHFLFR